MRILTDEKIIKSLKCPHCGSAMTVKSEGSGSLICQGTKPHCFDLSASGYVNLAPASRQGGGDSALAVKARNAFLEAGHYLKIAEAITSVLGEHISQDDDGIVLDAGCGEGYYSAKIAEQGYSTAGFDLSKPAVEAGAKRVKRMAIPNAFFGVASVFELPVADRCASAVTNIFAPCAESEYLRVLGEEGILVAVYAGKEHLMGLKRILYDRAYQNEVQRADLPESMRELDCRRLRFDIHCPDRDSVMSLFAMTPYYYRTSREDAQKLEVLSELSTEVDVMISVYGRK